MGTAVTVDSVNLGQHFYNNPDLDKIIHAVPSLTSAQTEPAFISAEQREREITGQKTIYCMSICGARGLSDTWTTGKIVTWFLQNKLFSTLTFMQWAQGLILYWMHHLVVFRIQSIWCVISPDRRSVVLVEMTAQVNVKAFPWPSRACVPMVLFMPVSHQGLTTSTGWALLLAAVWNHTCTADSSTAKQHHLSERMQPRQKL